MAIGVAGHAVGFGRGCALAMPYLQDDNARRPMPQPIKQEDSAVATQPLVVEEDTIPDSLLNARWRIQPTIPLTQDDLDRIPADLRTPDNIQYNVDYNDTIGGYLLVLRWEEHGFPRPS